MSWIRDFGRGKGMKHALSKKFEGSKFLRFGITTSKREAEKKAQEIKKKNFKYRITKSKDGYTLWTRAIGPIPSKNRLKPKKKSTVYVKGVGHIDRKSYDAIMGKFSY